MKNIYKFLTVFFVGLCTGFVAFFQMSKGSINKTEVNGKLKQKNTQGSSQTLNQRQSNREMRKHLRDAEKIAKQMEELTK